MSIYFREKTSPEIGDLIRKNALVILPVGTIEEHGPHLTVDADVAIAEDISREIGEMMKDEIPLTVMPAVWSGYTASELKEWPGTIIVKTRTFADMVSDICRSLIDMGFNKVMMVDCHGQHKPLLNMISKEIADDTGVYMSITSPAIFSKSEYEKYRTTKHGGSCHGGEWETSVLLYFGRKVDMSKAVGSDALRYHSDNGAGDATHGSQRVVWSTWGIQKSNSGIYGDPTTATAQLGGIIVEEVKKNYREFMLEFYSHDRDKV